MSVELSLRRHFSGNCLNETAQNNIAHPRTSRGRFLRLSAAARKKWQRRRAETRIPQTGKAANDQNGFG